MKVCTVVGALEIAKTHYLPSANMRVRVTVVSFCLFICLSTSDFEDPNIFMLEMRTEMNYENKISPLNVLGFFPPNN